MGQVYCDVYPNEAKEVIKTKSILLFGAVAKERHAAVSQVSQHRFLASYVSSLSYSLSF